MRFLFVAIFLILNLISNTQAQRIRYKNLFPLLQSKDYSTAEPQLLQFLEDNDDEANAYFYLGEVIVSKLDSVKIFPTTDQYDSMANRAIDAYKKSIALVDDRELRKNEEYYAAYNRRDLRTGKFGIKKSDVHLAYEKKIREVSQKMQLIDELHKLQEQSMQEYDQLFKMASGFYPSYPDETAFLLRAGSSDKQAAQGIINKYNSFTKSYLQFSEKLNTLNHPEYNPELNIIGIQNWEGLKISKIDSSNFRITIQNYETYLNNLLERIETEVKPLQEMLYKSNQELKEAITKNKAVKDSSDIVEITVSDELTTALSKFDKSNVIQNLLNYRQHKSETELLTNLNLFPVLADTSNIYQRANLIQDYQEKLSEQLDLIETIDNSLNDRTSKDFQQYLEEYKPSIEAYVLTEKTITKKKLDNVSTKRTEMAKQIQFFRNKSDSIYLTPIIAASNESKKYVLNTIELDSILIVVGLLNQKPFIATAGFDMRIEGIKMLQDSSFSMTNSILLNKNILVNLTKSEQESTVQMLHYFTPTLEEIWKLEFKSEGILGDAKVEAGIFFIYDQEGNVLQTLNSQGKVIGN